MSADIVLHFDRVRTKGSHDDLRLRIGSYQHRCDSYYFTLDDSPLVPGSLGLRLSRLLEQWSSQVASLRGEGGTVYLPYDFSDQCTAWLRVSSSDGQTAEVQAGWSLIKGWGDLPFGLPLHSACRDGLRPDRRGPSRVLTDRPGSVYRRQPHHPRSHGAIAR